MRNSCFEGIHLITDVVRFLAVMEFEELGLGKLNYYVTAITC